ncbi:MAG: hypothetical protein QOE35_3491 [Actinomycetota bacterium]
MDLNKLGRAWDRLGRDDPLWAVLYDPAKRGNRWDADEFFMTGREEIGATLEYVATLGIAVGASRALDFGCGVGRMTQALAAHFELVDGVDIAPSMVAQARSFDPPANCTFHVNQREDLSLFEDGAFAFVHSRLVLQHIPPSLTKGYLREFVRVLAPGGVAVFDLPSRPAATLNARIARVVPPLVLNTLRRVRYRSGAMEQHWIAPDEVRGILEAAGGRVADDGPVPAVSSALIAQHRYCVVRVSSAPRGGAAKDRPTPSRPPSPRSVPSNSGCPGCRTSRR